MWLVEGGENGNKERKKEKKKKKKKKIPLGPTHVRVRACARAQRDFEQSTSHYCFRCGGHAVSVAGVLSTSSSLSLSYKKKRNGRLRSGRINDRAALRARISTDTHWTPTNAFSNQEVAVPFRKKRGKKKEQQTNPERSTYLLCAFLSD